MTARAGSRGYAATRSAAGLFDFGFRATLRFTGADRATFLHNLLSNDIASLEPGGGRYTTLLTQQSRVVADGNVFCLEDSLRFDVDRALKSRAREHLEKFLVADEVEIDDPTESEAMLGVLGPRASEILRAAGAEIPEKELDHRQNTLGDASCWIARVDWSGDGGFQIVVASSESAAARAAIVALGEPRGLVVADRDDLEVLRIEAGIPWPGVDFDESHLVLEAGLERGIHFRKGCYLGQEVVERASSRGHVNRRLVGLRVEGTEPPAAADRITHEGAEVGKVTSSAFSPALDSPIALGYVRREVMEPGNRLHVGGGTPAEVVALPFYRAS
jgi:folate-binding protein YgfZ